MSTLTVEQVPIRDLSPHPENPRQGDLGALVESIHTNGFFNVVGAQRSTGHIIFGNHRWKAALAVREMIERDGFPSTDGTPWTVKRVITDDEGEAIREEQSPWTEVHGDLATVPVVWLDVNDEGALRMLIADNRLADLASYDDNQLAAILTDLAQQTELSLEGTGFDASDLDDLLRRITPPDLDNVRDDAGDPKPEDTWEVLRYVVPPDLHKRFLKVLGEMSGKDEVAQLRELVKRAARAA